MLLKNWLTTNIQHTKSLIWRQACCLKIEEQGTELFFRNLEFNTINNAYSNKSPFKYYISISEGWGYEVMLILPIHLVKMLENYA